MSEEVKNNELLTDKEAAKLLKVSARTVQRLRLAKKLKSIQVTPKLARIRPEHVQEYIERRDKAA